MNAPSGDGDRDRNARDDRRGGAIDVDVVVVGAGMAGLYLLDRLRGIGFACLALESADDVGGTWYWNRYPGARCDIQTVDYCYSFDPELEADWHWSERYATQPEILAYLQHVADRYDLRRDIRFSTRMAGATWDDATATWRVRTDSGDTLTCRFVVMATGCLSVPKAPDIPGVDRFAGDVYFTGTWPRDGVDLTGRRVGVIGTGSSGIQSIPILAEQAASLTVFQRTPNFSIPAHNGPVAAERSAEVARDRAGYRDRARRSFGGVPRERPTTRTLDVSDEERRAVYQAAWDAGELFTILTPFADTLLDADANETLAEFLRDRIRAIVDDPETADALCPTGYPFGTKRPCLDTGYYATFNRPNVRLVDLRRQPITTITERGVDTATDSFELDAIVFATGFDAMTGALVAVDIAGRDGVTLAERWADGPLTYLGLTSAGFPNLFLVTGPGSPSVLSNMAVSIEQHVDWIAECVATMRARGWTRIEPTEAAEAGWGRHVDDCAAITLYPRADSWYLGANVPGKPRVFLPYLGGVGAYRAVCDEVADRGYLGFAFDGPGGQHCSDGVVRRLQPDVERLLEFVTEIGLPPYDTLPVPDARALSAAVSAERPPGPEVGEVVDGMLPGAGGELAYRLYRPATPGPHPIVVYFHGGGWVLGSADSDDPFCRDLCARSNAIVVSTDYRHAPEHRFPAAHDDAFAAVGWVAANATELGGEPGRLAVCGWSAGANLATAACALARDAGGPAIAGQVLVNPVTDGTLASASYTDNADGYLLTAAMMGWFWDLYADPADRTDPRVSPVRSPDLAGLPPAIVVTAEFDPLRDEGAAYAEALAAAGVEVTHLPCRGHIHMSPMLVGTILSGEPIRAEIAAGLRRTLGAVRSTGIVVPS